ncbi:hypothetical protein WJR50_05380 [Catalinimonas sp. 4WD22]|uniref:hypothetical protein n=1 Tax=Catalinimonas locisalis TaxID=3133978 RepID=UPI003101129E
MNRKKILICLNGQDDAQLEMAFIHHQLTHPHHQIMKFHLESITVEDLAEAYLPLATQAESPAQQGVSVQETAKAEATFANKKQVIYSSSIKELITESLYADLLVIRNANYYADCTYYGQHKPIYEVLKKAGCPIMVIPDKLCEIQQIILIYDGNLTSLSGIKLLRMVLSPICRNIPITVLIPCSKDASTFPANEEKMLIEYLRFHFKDLGVHKICEDSVHTIHFAIDPLKNILLVNNFPDQSPPSFMREEIEKLKLAHNNEYFLFIASA